MNKSKIQFFEKINKIDKSLTRLKKNLINKVKNEKGEITSDSRDMQRIIREYYEPLYANEMDNLQLRKNGQILRKVQPPKFNWARKKGKL